MAIDKYAWECVYKQPCSWSNKKGWMHGCTEQVTLNSEIFLVFGALIFFYNKAVQSLRCRMVANVCMKPGFEYLYWSYTRDKGAHCSAHTRTYTCSGHSIFFLVNALFGAERMLAWFVTGLCVCTQRISKRSYMHKSTCRHANSWPSIKKSSSSSAYKPQFGTTKTRTKTTTLFWYTVPKRMDNMQRTEAKTCGLLPVSVELPELLPRLENWLESFEMLSEPPP